MLASCEYAMAGITTKKFGWYRHGSTSWS